MNMVSGEMPEVTWYTGGSIYWSFENLRPNILKQLRVFIQQSRSMTLMSSVDTLFASIELQKRLAKMVGVQSGRRIVAGYSVLNEPMM